MTFKNYKKAPAGVHCWVNIIPTAANGMKSITCGKAEIPEGDLSYHWGADGGSNEKVWWCLDCCSKMPNMVQPDGSSTPSDYEPKIVKPKMAKTQGAMKKWVYYPHTTSTNCSVSDCRADICCGNICIAHADTGYGCEKCAKEWEGKVWGEYIPLQDTAIPSNEPKIITITSFKYGNGTPDAPLGTRTFDLRKTVRNPWKDPVLRKKTGLDLDVQAYIAACPKSMKIVEQIEYNVVVGFSTINVGCQGGKHRSVAVAEMAAARIRSELNFEVNVIHRDLKVK